MPTKENRPAGNGADSTTPTRCSHYIVGLRQRKIETYRREPLDCGCVDPWTCRCYDPAEPSSRQVDGYRDAIVHLAGLQLLAAPSLPALRAMWCRGGTDRRLAADISRRWELAA